MNSTMTEHAAASYVGLSRRSLQKMRHERRGPTYLKIGKAVRYRRADLDDFLNAHRIVVAA